jgi:uncharacterized protein DUF839
MRRARLVLAVAAVTILVSAQAGTAKPGFRTQVPPMLTLAPGAPAESNVKAIISSGDEFGSFTFEGLPDGIGFVDRGTTVDVYVTHEQSRVPFPVAAPGVTGLRDFQDSSISQLTVNVGGKVLDAEVALPATEGLIRFCSAFMASIAEGFASPVFFANEESNDALVVPTGALYGADPFYATAPPFPSDPNRRQAGYAVYLDTATGHYDVIPGMGRMNHENTVVVPGGWGGVVTVTGDDTFSAPSSQLYLYKALSAAGVLADTGDLYAFRVTGKGGVALADPTDAFNGANDYGDIVVGDDWQGEFIPVPPAIADGTDPGNPAMAPQEALERWSNENNVFQFIRVEDLAYDKNEPNVVYFADTGERRAVVDTRTAAAGGTGRLLRGSSSTNGPFPNGRVFRIELDPANPLHVTHFSILLNNDLGGYNNTAVMHQPDNVDTSANSLMVQEDSGQPPNSRIWRYSFATGTWTVMASVNAAAWESSGIVNASDGFGPGSWLVTVQAHDVFVDQSGPLVPGTTVDKREGGQLLLVRLPGT